MIACYQKPMEGWLGALLVVVVFAGLLYLSDAIERRKMRRQSRLGGDGSDGVDNAK
jgi:hypothetical protein